MHIHTYISYIYPIYMYIYTYIYIGYIFQTSKGPGGLEKFPLRLEGPKPLEHQYCCDVGGVWPP